MAKTAENDEEEPEADGEGGLALIWLVTDANSVQSVLFRFTTICMTKGSRISSA